MSPAAGAPVGAAEAGVADAELPKLPQSSLLAAAGGMAGIGIAVCATEDGGAATETPPKLPQSSLLEGVASDTAAAGARTEAGGARDGVGTGVAATEPPPKLPQSSLLAAVGAACGAAACVAGTGTAAAGARVGGDGSGAPDIIASKAPHLLSSPLISGASSFSTTISDAAVSVGKVALASVPGFPLAPSPVRIARCFRGCCLGEE